jgi:hypothetical protein
MTTTERLPGPREERPAAPSTPRISGDERFVPASHVLVSDRQVSHPAFRLWCVLHRLWFLHEPPAMELLQELMGTYVEVKEESDQPAPKGKRRDRPKVWQPASRRSIERWLCELEGAGWLVWARREEPSRRYHLRTSAKSAGDAAVLRELRALLNSGAATLADVQSLLGATTAAWSRNETNGLKEDDATPESHPQLPLLTEDDQDAAQATAGSHDATSGSHGPGYSGPDTPAGSQHTISLSYGTTTGSHKATAGSHEATAESHDAILPSHQRAGEGVLTPEKNGLKHEIHQIRDLPTEITPPPAPASVEGGGGGGPTATERYLLRAGFNAKVAHEFRSLDLAAVQADAERRRELGQGLGAMVTAWRVEPPQALAESGGVVSAIAARAASAKAEALAIAPPDASALEIQYLALDIEDGTLPAAALANLQARRRTAGAGGVA